MPVISVKNLVKKYKKAENNAVDDVSFDVKESEFFAFLGPNGAGKTTTISILTTTLSKTSGQVLIDGLDIEEESSKVRERVGIIFQNPSIDLNLTAEENIRFHTVLYGIYPFAPSFKMMPQAYKDRVLELTELVGIKEDLNKPVKQFSGGMKRKLEIVRSLIHNPKVLFLDEPTVGLDPESRRNLWEYINTTRKNSGITVFLTTHYLDEVEDADKVCVINKGKIVANGSPDELKNKLAKEYVLLETTKDAELNLESQLKTDSYKFEKDNSKFKVFVSDPEGIKKLISSINVPLKNLDVHKPTLEDAYLDIIREEFDI
jgi:ABC-2 type transport system ATP-binding protein